MATKILSYSITITKILDEENLNNVWKHEQPVLDT